MSSSSRRVALVTGSNKGIGYAIVRGLCKQFDGDVILTARTESNGQDAIKRLNGEGLHPKFHQLDITDKASIDRIGQFLKSTYGGLDILVNNAGISYKAAATTPFKEQAEVTLATNFWGTLNACNTLFPLLRPHARVVNVSSMVSQFTAKKCSKELQNKFTDPDLTMANVEQLMTEFVSSAKDGSFRQKGWPESAYGASKVGVTLMSFVQQKQLNSESREDIIVNACCPGYVDTDLTSHKGTKTIDEGADTPLYLAMLPPNTNSPKGNFVSERKIGTLL
ncbi:carbonyl reductase [NADPH] 1-like [Mya arenaria]|uniref:carbonyl reductase [NADPH] 1-like n=1 Tax=Mya arenaria TaxID=6604 RepID=UPI0022E27DE1|nr:carbonyl reductase [NADPH] 1-like [Mya arenaria]